MSLFVCGECQTVDNTALAPGYWTTVVATVAADPFSRSILCTACHTGEWHDRFPRRRYDRAVDGRLGAGRRLISHEMREAPPC